MVKYLQGIPIDAAKHRLALPLLERRLGLLDAAMRGRGNSRHVYSHGAGYGELLALAVALDKGLDFIACAAAHQTAVAVCNSQPFASFK